MVFEGFVCKQVYALNCILMEAVYNNHIDGVIVASLRVSHSYTDCSDLA